MRGWTTPERSGDSIGVVDRVVADNHPGHITLKAAIPHMIEPGEAPSGSLVSGRPFGVPGLPAYCAQGWPLAVEAVALDYGVNKVRAMYSDPKLLRQRCSLRMRPFADVVVWREEGVLCVFSRFPLPGSPSSETAGLCSFLASDDASFVTATVIPVDGGACVVDVSGAAINQLAAQHLGG
jgi:NAD(P)-dependent dehydrogenase (short-subunit alcohol dehydrogenase family)